MPRTSYFQQVARQGIGDRPDFHPPHALLRRWQTLQEVPSAGGPTAAPVADLPAPALSNTSSGRDSVHLPPEIPAFLPRLSQQDDTVPLVEQTPQPGTMSRTQTEVNTATDARVEQTPQPGAMLRAGSPTARPATLTPFSPTAEVVWPEQTVAQSPIQLIPTSHPSALQETRQDTPTPAPAVPPARAVAAPSPVDRQPSRVAVPIRPAPAVTPQRVAPTPFLIDTPFVRADVPSRSAPPAAAAPLHAGSDYAVPTVILTPTPMPRPLPVHEAKPPEPSVSIGSLEIRIVSPASTQAQPSPAQTPKTSPSPTAPLARGFVSAFGLRQG